MNFCSNCGNPIAASSKFCSKCGAPVAAAPVVAEPVVAEPVYTAPVEPVYTAPAEPVYTAPAAPAAPVYARPAQPQPQPQSVSKQAKIFGFIGMGTGIGGLALAAMGVLYTLVAMFEDGAAAFGMSIGFSIFSIPLSIAGMILSNKAREAGNNSAPPSVGAKLGLVGCIVSGVMIFLGFIGLLIEL